MTKGASAEGAQAQGQDLQQVIKALTQATQALRPMAKGGAMGAASQPAQGRASAKAKAKANKPNGSKGAQPAGAGPKKQRLPFWACPCGADTN